MASYYTSGYTPPAGVVDAQGVKDIQQQLVAAGLNIGSTGVDGVWGKNTQAAYEAYQKGTPTYAALGANTAGVPGGGWPALSQSSERISASGASSPKIELPTAPQYDIGGAYDKSATEYKNALEAAYNAQKADLDAQAEILGKQYDSARNQAYVGARLNAIGNNEVLAAKGLAGNVYQGPISGVSETSRIAENVGMRNNIHAATLQEQNQRDGLALELVKAGYTRDLDYAKYMAENLIAKANAEEASQQRHFENEMALAQARMAAEQQAFENQLAMAKMYASQYGSGSGSSGSGNGGSGGAYDYEKDLREMSMEERLKLLKGKNTKEMNWGDMQKELKAVYGDDYGLLMNAYVNRGTPTNIDRNKVKVDSTSNLLR